MRVLAALAALLLIPAPASAHHTTSRVHDIRHVAANTWGPDVCGDTMTVAIIRVHLPPPTIGRAYPAWNGRPCHIAINDQAWDTETLCIVLVHEYGHLAGWRAPPGQAYRRPNGTLDELHSRNPRSLMYPVVTAHYPPCRRDRIRRAAAHSNHPGGPE